MRIKDKYKMTTLRFQKAFLTLYALTTCVFMLNAAGRTLYVDGGISSPSSSTYSVASRSCGSGSDQVYRSYNDAAGAAQPGDTVYIRGGTYNRQFAPQCSGNASAPITFSNYNDETVTLSGFSQVGLYIINRSYLVIRGINLSNVVGWARLENAHHNLIEDCTFSVATNTGTTGGFKIVSSNDNRMLGNAFNDGNDNMVVQDSNRNVIQDNTFYQGRHSLLSIRCCNYTVVRGNLFDNPIQKAIEIFDCEGVSDAPYKLDATRHNLIEDNEFVNTRSHSYKHYYYNGIQFAGQEGIVRRNVFYHNLGGGISVQVYSDEALYNYKNRIYNNTFYNNQCYGLSASGVSRSSYHDNRVKNNLFYKNTSCSGGAVQNYIPNTTAMILSDNAVLDEDPLFINADANVFQLQAGSAAIDAGAFLTHAVGSGSGTVIQVDDVGYFFDGFSIANETGDEVQLEGQTQRARILSIDFQNKTLTLDAPMTWVDGQGLSLAYSSSAPDQGAFESDGADPEPVILSTPLGFQLLK